MRKFGCREKCAFGNCQNTAHSGVGRGAPCSLSFFFLAATTRRRDKATGDHCMAEQGGHRNGSGFSGSSAGVDTATRQRHRLRIYSVSITPPSLSSKPLARYPGSWEIFIFSAGLGRGLRHHRSHVQAAFGKS